MFSYHPIQRGEPHRYAIGWQSLPSDDIFALARAIRSHVTSPLLFKDGRRRKDFFQAAYWIGLDFDEGPTLREIHHALCDHIHVLGTTKSHGLQKGHKPPCDRFRLWLKLTAPICSPLEYEATVRFYVDRYEADKACVDAARFFWPCAEIVSIEAEGETADIVRPPETVYAPVKRYAKKIPEGVQELLDGKFLVRDSRNTTCFSIAASLTVCQFEESEIVDILMNSAVPVGPHVLGEVKSAVRNGRRHAIKEMAEKQKGAARKANPFSH